MEGWVDLGYSAMHRPRVELAISRSQVWHHGATCSSLTAFSGIVVKKRCHHALLCTSQCVCDVVFTVEQVTVSEDNARLLVNAATQLRSAVTILLLNVHPEAAPNSFTATISRKFAVQQSLNIPPPLKCVPKLPFTKRFAFFSDIILWHKPTYSEAEPLPVVGALVLSPITSPHHKERCSDRLKCWRTLEFFDPTINFCRLICNWSS